MFDCFEKNNNLLHATIVLGLLTIMIITGMFGFWLGEYEQSAYPFQQLNIGITCHLLPIAGNSTVFNIVCLDPGVSTITHFNISIREDKK